MDTTEVRVRFTTSVANVLARPTLKRVELGIPPAKKLAAFSLGRSSLCMAVPYEVCEGRNITIGILVDTEERTSQIQVVSEGCVRDARYARSLGVALVELSDIAEEIEALCATLLADLPEVSTDG